MIPPDLVERLHRAGTLRLTLKVTPKSSRNEIVGIGEDGSLKVRVTAAPEKGQANAAVCELLAREFGLPKRNVSILRGATSHTKTVLLTI